LLAAVDGKVWEWIVPSGEVDRIRRTMLVSGTLRRSDGVRVRALAAEQPSPEARHVPPNLEDAYLYFIGDQKPK